MAENQNNDYIRALLDGLPVEQSAEQLSKDLYDTCGFEAGGQLKPLKSIVAQVGGVSSGGFFQPSPLTLEPEDATTSVFAETTERPNLDGWTATAQADYKAFQEALGDSQYYPYSLYHFVHAYGSRVAYGKHEDASLFDRNRVLAAVTACRAKAAGANTFLLVKGAISGIQKYIYHNIKAEQIGDAEKTAKRLRGRSFLVSFINQVIAEYLVEQLGLEQANVLFVGGGHFTLLLPEEQAVQDDLKELLKNVNLGLLKNVGPQLSLLTASASCGQNIGNGFAEAYENVNKALEEQKQRRYKGYLSEVFTYFDQHDEKAEEKQRNRAINEEVRIGTLTPYANYILEVNGDPQALAQLDGKLHQEAAIKSLSFLGKRFYILKDETKGEEDDKELQNRLFTFLSQDDNQALLASFPQLKIIALNKPEISHIVAGFSSVSLGNLCYGFRFVGKYAPIYKETTLFGDPMIKPGEVMLFDDLAKLNSAKDYKPDLTHQQLGVLRLDVDDLGAVFGHGLGDNHSVERLLCLSREFELFFGGYFNQLARAHHMYVTYSGGDDAFVIGSWWNALRFAHALKGEFDRFTEQNRNLKFSAGLFICNPHYPIPRLAKDAEKLEGEAKKYNGSETDIHPLEARKDAFHVFNHTLSWASFNEMMHTSEIMLGLVGEGEAENSGSMKRSMIRRFLRIINVHNDKRFSKVPEAEIMFERMRHISALHGLLSRHGYGRSRLEDRNIDRDQTGALIRDMLQKANDHSPEGQHAFEHYIVPLHIALYQSKTN
jgi:CRISPR-associated protein Csm1